MNAAGIDVSSRKSTVAVLRPLGEVVRVPFDVTHDAEGLASLAEQLKALDGETRVVMEHTGRYYEPVAKALHEAGLYVSAVNPILIKEYGANSLRRVKTFILVHMTLLVKSLRSMKSNAKTPTFS